MPIFYLVVRRINLTFAPRKVLDMLEAEEKESHNGGTGGYGYTVKRHKSDNVEKSSVIWAGGIFSPYKWQNADVAQLIEHHFPKVRVRGFEPRHPLKTFHIKQTAIRSVELKLIEIRKVLIDN